MYYFFIILIFVCSNTLSLEQNDQKKQEGFFNKTPSEQRNIFIDKIKINDMFYNLNKEFPNIFEIT